MGDLVELYCSIDDFWKFFKSEWDKHLIEGKSVPTSSCSQI